MKTITLTGNIPTELNDMRLDAALAKLFSDYSRSQLKAWIQQGQVSINNEIVTNVRYSVKTDQHINIHAEVATNEQWQPQQLPLTIVFEDDSIIIVNKAAGMISHPGAGNPDGTLVNALLNYAPELAELPRAGLIHRLDKDTSGLLVIARNLAAHHALTQALQARDIHREYQAIVNGTLISGGSIDEPIGRHPVARTKMSVHPQGRDAITHYRLIQKFRCHTHVRVILETGRTHQIRVHFAHIHHPLVGDPTYSKPRIAGKLSDPLRQGLKQLTRQALHAAKLSLLHPKTQVTMQFTAPLPDDMQKLLTLLEDDLHANP